MGWQDKLKEVEFTILTGEGSLWSPKWLPRTRTLGLNNTVYEYPRLGGSFVDRREAKGEKYNLEFVFDGDAGIDNANSFLAAAKDLRPWTVTHPYHGTLTVQPITISQDNTVYNVSRFTVSAINTVLSEQPAEVRGIPGEITELKALTDVSITGAYIAGLPTVTAADAGNMAETIAQYDEIQSAYLTGADDLARFKTLVAEAASAAANLISDAEAGIRQLTNLLNFPFTVAQSLEQRFASLISQYELLAETVEGAGIDAPGVSDKEYFTAAAAAVISTAALVSTLEPETVRTEENTEDDEEQTEYTLESEYPSRASIVEQMQKISDFYNAFNGVVDSISTERGDLPGSFNLAPSISASLSQIIYYTLRNLEAQISGARQEREVVLGKDSDVINIAHRYLGGATEANIEKLIGLNALGLNSMQTVKAGTKILYYA